MELPRVVLVVHTGRKVVVPEPPTVASGAAAVEKLGDINVSGAVEEDEVKFVGALEFAVANAEGGSPPSVCASPAFSA
jgi:hypothetical protein